MGPNPQYHPPTSIFFFPFIPLCFAREKTQLFRSFLESFQKKRMLNYSGTKRGGWGAVSVDPGAFQRRWQLCLEKFWKKGELWKIFPGFYCCFCCLLQGPWKFLAFLGGEGRFFLVTFACEYFINEKKHYTREL